MNELDVAILVVMGVFALYAAIKGMARLAIGVAGIFLGVALASLYGDALADRLGGWFESEAARRFAALSLIFLGTVAAAMVVAWLVVRTLKAAKLRWIDRLAGAGVGILLAAALISAAMVPLTAMLPQENTLLEDSFMAPWVLRISAVASSLVPEKMKARFDAARQRLKERSGDVLKKGVDALDPAGVGGKGGSEEGKKEGS